MFFRKSKISIIALLLLFALLLFGCQGQNEDGVYTVGDLYEGLEMLQESVERLEENIDTSGSYDMQMGETFLITEGGEYPPGMYAGQCSVKSKPKELVVGMEYEVIYISSQFMRWDEEVNKWIAVGQTTPPRNLDEFHSPPEPPKAGIHLGGMTEIRGPGKYELRTTGYIQQYVVEEAQTVGRGPVPRKISSQDVEEVITFTVVGD